MADLIPGLEGIPCAASSVSFINGTEGVLEYRGFRIETLAEHCSFEEAAWLLLHGELPNRAQLEGFDAALRKHRALAPEVLGMLRALPRGGHPMKALQAGVAAMGACYPMDMPPSAADAELATLRLIAQLPTLVAAFDRLRSGQEPVAPSADLGHAANFLYMLSGDAPDPARARTMEVALILHMEHTMNASTFTARVIASTLADPFAVISGAIGSLTGSLHGGANERALEELRVIPSVDQVEEIITGKIERKEKIMGLGHRVYKTKDPRSTILQQLAEALFQSHGKSEVYDVAKAVEDVATGKLGHKGIFPNVDFYSGILYDKLELKTDLFTPVFAIARVVGWLAHWQEQLVGNRIFRPTQVYTGGHVRPFTEIDAR